MAKRTFNQDRGRYEVECNFAEFAGGLRKHLKEPGRSWRWDKSKRVWWTLIEDHAMRLGSLAVPELRERWDQTSWDREKRRTG